MYTNTYKLCCKNVGAGLTSFSRASWRRWCGSTSSGWTSTSRCCGWKMWKIGIRGNLTNDVTDDRSLNFLFSETPPSVWDSSTQLAKKGSWPLLMIKDACPLNHGRLKRSFRPNSKGRMRNVWFGLTAQWNPANFDWFDLIWFDLIWFDLIDLFDSNLLLSGTRRTMRASPKSSFLRTSKKKFKQKYPIVSPSTNNVKSRHVY